MRMCEEENFAYKRNADGHPHWHLRFGNRILRPETVRHCSDGSEVVEVRSVRTFWHQYGNDKSFQTWVPNCPARVAPWSELSHHKVWNVPRYGPKSEVSHPNFVVYVALSKECHLCNLLNRSLLHLIAAYDYRYLKDTASLGLSVDSQLATS